MAEVTPKSNILEMANGDTYTPNGRKIAIAGVRLTAGSGAAATGIITDENDRKIYSLAAVQSTDTEATLCTNADTNVLKATVTGTGAVLLVYLK